MLLLFSHKVMSNSLPLHGLQDSPSFTISYNLLKLMSIELAMPINHLILYFSLLLLSSIVPSIRLISSSSNCVAKVLEL